MNSHDDARRITACINACAGISTEALEESARSGQRVSEMLLKQREELLEALELCKFDSLNMSMTDLGFIRAAIERCKP